MFSNVHAFTDIKLIIIISADSARENGKTSELRQQSHIPELTQAHNPRFLVPA